MREEIEGWGAGKRKTPAVTSWSFQIAIQPSSAGTQ
jgi:hypothetical protein